MTALVLGKRMMAVFGALSHTVPPSAILPSLCGLLKCFPSYYSNNMEDWSTVITCKTGQIILDLRSLSSLWLPQSLNIVTLPVRTSPLPRSLLWESIRGCY